MMPEVLMSQEWFDVLCGLTGIVVGGLFIKAIMDAYLN